MVAPDHPRATRGQPCKCLCQLIRTSCTFLTLVNPARLTLCIDRGAAEVFGSAKARGLQIDKPEVRLVVHWTLPPTPEVHTRK